MIQGLYTAAGGMLAVEKRQDILANNIANVSTPGYKRHAPVQLGFNEIFSETLRRPFHFDSDSAPAGGVRIVESYSDLAAGVLRKTDNPFQMALIGPGYFVIDTPEGDRYSRSGDFMVDPQGELATHEGYKVLGINGQPISVDGAEVNIGADGGVQVDGFPAGQLQIVEFAEPTRLLREGDNLYFATDEVLENSAQAAETQVAHKHLEMSNVNLPNELINMMMGMRAYEANQQVIQALDGTVGRLIEQVGMPTM